MAKAKGTEKQQDIKRRLLADEPVNEIARAHNTTAQAIYSQISRMRQMGMLPKKRRGRVVAAESPNGRSAPSSASDNGQPKAISPTLEDHLSRELEEVTARIGQINIQIASLQEEGRSLTVRQSKLQGAARALDEEPGAPGAQRSEQAAAA